MVELAGEGSMAVAVSVDVALSFIGLELLSAIRFNDNFALEIVVSGSKPQLFG